MKSLLLMSLIIFSSMAKAGLEENKKIVLNFYEQAFNQHQATEAAMKYLSEEYVQHNPHVASGRKAFIDAFKKYYSDKKNLRSVTVFKRTIAEGDLVVLHSHKKNTPDDRGVAGIDIFRLKEGKITEHWDVNQPIPEKMAHDNTMF